MECFTRETIFNDRILIFGEIIKHLYWGTIVRLGSNCKALIFDNPDGLGEYLEGTSHSFGIAEEFGNSAFVGMIVDGTQSVLMSPTYGAIVLFINATL